MSAMISRLRAETALDGTVGRVLDDVIALLGAEFGDLQLALPDRSLMLVTQNGFARPFLLGMRKLTAEASTVCVRAFLSQKPTTVPDVHTDRPFSKYLDIAQKAGFKAVHSQPLTADANDPVGVVSALFANPHSPTGVELHMLDEYSRFAADHLVGLLRGKDVNAEAERLFLSMLDGAP